MMKFFRKHNKELLAVFMAMLMIVFIGGSALQGMLTPSLDRVVATSTLGEISYIDQQRANATTQLLGMMMMDWSRPLGRQPKPLEIVDWILLSREAEKLGTAYDVAAVRSLMPTESLQETARQLRVKPARLLEAMREMRSIQQTAYAVGAAAAPSEAEVQSAARDVLETVDVNALILPAEAFVDDAWTFTEAELQEQFEKYRETEAVDGLNFGYYQHPAIKVQFIQIERDKIAEQVKVPNLEKLAKDYYDKNRERERDFRRPPEEVEAAKEAVGPAPEPYLTWEEARPKAEQIIRKRQADAAAEKIANWLVQYASQPWLTAERGDDGYKATPEPVARLDYYNELLDKIPPSIVYRGAVHEWRSPNFFTAETAGDVSLIGATSFLPERGAPSPFTRLAFQNKFIVPAVPQEDGVNSAEFLAPFQTCPYAMENRLSGDLFVFRVVEGRDGRPAESLEDVRDQVVADLRLQKAYGVAKAKAESVLGCDPEMSLRELYITDPELADLEDSPGRVGVDYTEPEPFGRTPAYLKSQGRPEMVLVFGGVGELPSTVVEGLFQLEDAADNKAMFELPDRATILVAEWVATKRPDDESYLELHEQLETELSQRRYAEVISGWLDPDQIRARNGFKITLE